MKIIDLLNKIANGEEVPKKIKYQNYIYEYQHRRDTESSFNYMCNENGEYLSRRYFIDNILTDEVEIIEENKKIEKFDPCIGGIMGFDGVTNVFSIYKDEINKLIDAINELKDSDN